MNWGFRIVMAFVFFVGVLVAMVYISVNQDVSLVAENYYEEELAYEDQIQRIKNSNALVEQIEFKLNRQTWLAEFEYPDELKADFVEGKIHLFRPSNAKLDKEYIMLLGKEGVQKIDLKTFSAGLWKVKINWKSKEKEYYKELNLVL